VEFRKALIIKRSGIPNKVFLEFFREWNSEKEEILNSSGEWNSENKSFFRCFFSYLRTREWNSENGRSGIPKIEEWNSENRGVEFRKRGNFELLRGVEFRIIYHLYIIFIF